jgi:hypothetical protein
MNDKEPDDPSARGRKEQTTPIGRDDEAGFRTAVPREIHGFEILEVSGFTPGSPRTDAAAVATWTVQHSGGDVEFGTHQLILRDDCDGPLRWTLANGRYGMATREEARQDTIRRVG